MDEFAIMSGNYWRDAPESYLSLEDESHRYFLHPWLRDYITDHFKPASILDFGAGDGSLFHGFDAGHKSLVLYDTSARMLNSARGLFAGDNRARFASDPESLGENEFNLIVCSLVLMTVPSEQGLRDICELMYRKAAPEAHCLAAITHPCFRQYPFSTFSTEFTDKPFPYTSEGTPFSVTLRDAGGGAEVSFVDYHWPLGLTINIFTDAGFYLRQMYEIPDIAANERLENKRFPAYIVFDLLKT